MQLNWFKRIKPLDEDTEYDLNHVKKYLSLSDQERVEEFVKTRVAKFQDESAPSTLMPFVTHSILQTKVKDEEVIKFLEAMNTKIRAAAQEEYLHEFGKIAYNQLTARIPALLPIAKLIALQLAADKFHLLLISDTIDLKPVLTAAANLSARQSTGSAKQLDALLRQADNGLCCITDLEQLPSTDRITLAQAADKGLFGNRHEQQSFHTNILALAKAKNALRGETPAVLRRQAGFDEAFLKHFTIALFVKKKQYKPSMPKPLSTADTAFIHEHLRRARQSSVAMHEDVEKRIEKLSETINLAFSDATKALLLLAASHARLELRTEILRRDVDEAASVLQALTE